MRTIEPQFAPRLSRIETGGASEPLTPSPGAPATVTLPIQEDGGTVLTAIFARGLTLDGSTSSLRSAETALTAEPGFAITGTNSNSATVNVTASLMTIGARRRQASDPFFLLSFSTKNEAGFETTTTQNDALNQVRVTFSNISPVAVDDSFVVAGVGDFNGNVLNQGVDANNRGDRDPDSNDFTAEIDQQPALGAVVLNANGNFVYTPPATTQETMQSTSFTYFLRDGEGAISNTATVSIDILGVPNRAPVAQDDQVVTNEDTPLMGNVLLDNGGGADSDPDNSSLTVSGTPMAQFGSVTLNPNGDFTYTPNLNATGDPMTNQDSFTYELRDGGGLTDTATVTITINPVNDPPVAADRTFQTPGDMPLTRNLVDLGLVSDVDDDDASLTVEEASPATIGSVAIQPNGVFVYTPPSPPSVMPQTATFTYRARDGSSASNTATVTINVLGVAPMNNPPVARDDEFTTAEDTQLTSVNVLQDNGNGVDFDPDPATNLTVNLFRQADFGEVVLSANGDFTYTPDPNATGAAMTNLDTFQYQLSDGSLVETATVRITIMPVNDTPVAEDGDFTVAGDGQLAANIFDEGLATDVDGDTLTTEVASAATLGSVVIQPNGDFIYTPPSPPSATQQIATFTYRAIDGSNASDTGTVTVTVQGVVVANRPPAAQNDRFQTDEDTPLAGDVFADNGSGADMDPDGDPLMASISRQASFGVAVLNANGMFTYTPDRDVAGDPMTNEDSFEYSVTDGQEVVSAVVTILVRPVNDAPVAMTIQSPTVNEAQGEQTFNLLDPNFVADADGDDLSVSQVVVTVTAPTLSNPVLRTQVNDGMLSFDPQDLDDLDNDESAEVVVVYQISDGGAPPVAGRLEVTISGLDNGVGRVAGQYAETIRGRYNQHFLTQNEANASCHTCHQVGQVDADVDSVNDCTATVFTPYGLMICRGRDPGQMPLTDLQRRLAEVEAAFAPRLNATPSLAVPFDAAPGAPIGQPLTASAGFTVDRQPSRVLDFAIVNQNTMQLSNTDADGQFTIDASGQLRVAGPLTPGEHTIDVRPINDAGQRDNNGALRNGVPGFYPIEAPLLRFVTITVTMTEPVVVSDDFNVAQNTPLTFDVLANDQGGAAQSIRIVSMPANGTVVVNADNMVTYSPNPNFFGPDSFEYMTVGEGGESNVGRVTLDIVEADGAVAIDDEAVATLDQATRIDVLSNDLGLRPFTTSIVTPPSAGDAQVRQDGQIDFTPQMGFTGEVTLRYRIANAVAASEADVTIQVVDAGAGTLSNAVRDPALRRVARALGDSCTAISGAAGPANDDQNDLLGICGLIADEAADGGDIDSAMRAIRPEEALAVTDLALLSGRAAHNVVFDRLRRTRGGAGRGVDFGGFRIAFGQNSVAGADVAPLADEFVDSLLGADREIADAFGRFGVFLGGDVTFANRKSTANLNGYELDSYSVLGGVDYAVNDNVLIGGGIGFSTAKTIFAGGGEITADTVQVVLFGSIEQFVTPGLRLDGMIGGGKTNYDLTRHIGFAAGGGMINRSARADFDGLHFNVAGRLEYDLAKTFGPDATFDSGNIYYGPWDVSIFTDFDYLYAATEDYVEQGAGGLSLRMQTDDHQSLLTDVGTRIGLPIGTVVGDIKPFAELSVNAELLGERPSAVASFAAIGANAPTFRIVGERSEEVFGRAVLGAEGEIAGASVAIEYETSFAREDLSEERISLTVNRQLLGDDRLGVSMGFGFSDDRASQTNMQIGFDYSLRF